MAASDDAFFVAFADGRNGDSDVFVAKLDETSLTGIFADGLESGDATLWGAAAR